MKVVADVGCGHQLTALPAPAAVRGRGVSCIYIYISIYLYIYAFPSQSLISDSMSQLGCWCCRRIQNEGPFLMVLWLGLDQTRQHLFTEVRIPGCQRQGNGGKIRGISYSTHLPLNTWQAVLATLYPALWPREKESDLPKATQLACGS